MNASVAIQSLPEAANDEELIRIVDEVIDYNKSTCLNYYVGSRRHNKRRRQQKPGNQSGRAGCLPKSQKQKNGRNRQKLTGDAL